MKKEALYYKRLHDKKIQCQLCPQFCVIENKQIGKCGVRENSGRRLISLNYAKPSSISIDPIEKKPLYHFFPGEKTLSIGSFGCNLKCDFCQNQEISQEFEKDVFKKTKTITPEKIISIAKKNKIKIISYTYNEPIVFYEYMLDIAKLAKKENIKNVVVTNGFINKTPLNKLCKVIDAANIDLKSIDEKFYEQICQGKLQPVLETIKKLKQENIWLELTNLIIPGLNDDLYEIRKLIAWGRDNLGYNVPLHFSKFYPCYRIIDKDPTNPEIIKKARKIALDVGLKYVYTGNIYDSDGETSFCAKCKKPIVFRKGFELIENKLKEGKCSCGEKISGVW